MLFVSRSIVPLILAPLLFVTEGVAVTSLADGYAVRTWRTEDGLPQNLVTSAVQTREGYLWFGTHSGLTRFDGEKFEVFDPTNTPALENAVIGCLFEEADGTLWIGHETGAVTRYRHGVFEHVDFPSSAKTERVYGIGSDENGRRWAMRLNGVVDSLDGGGSLPNMIGTERPGVMAWSRSPGGAIWMAANGSTIRLRDGHLEPQAVPPPVQSNYAVGIAAAADGGVWILCDGRVRKWRDGAWVEDRGEDPWPPASISCCLELRDGTLAIGTIYFGVYLIFKDHRPPVHLDQNNSLPQNWVRFLYEDREGNLWAGLGSAGLVSIRATAFSTLNAPDRWHGCTILAVAAGANGTLWIGTDGAALHRYQGGEWKLFGGEEGLTNPFIPAVTESDRGVVWVSENWWGGPYRLAGDHFVRPASVDASTRPALALLTIPGTDDLLIGDQTGLRRLHGDGAAWLIKPEDSSKGAVCALALGRDGAIWCGFTQGGIARIVEGKVDYFTQRDGLASNAVQCLHVDEEGALWIGTADLGLSRFKNGRFARLSLAEGLVDRCVAHILDDGLGFFWISTHHGLQRITKSTLNRCADGASPTFVSQVYDQSDGLPTIEFTGGLQATGCKTADGHLWFPTSKGLLAVDPAGIVPNPIVPPVVLSSLLVDGRSVPLAGAAAARTLRPDHARLEFGFSGLSFAAPNKVRFKYLLEGIDRDWIDAGGKRSAFYSRLPAGTYRFRVVACNNDGVWNNDGAVLAFTVAPFFWQTWWFGGVVLVTTTTGIAWIARSFTRRRMQRKIEAMQREHEIERERARIAQDIHDDVGASLSRIAMLSQPARGDLAAPERAGAMLARIYTTAIEVTRSLDEIVWAVDPRHDTLDSLVDYMAKFAQNFLAASRLRCRLDLPVQVPAWPLNAEVRHNLFLAFKEAMNNAFKHAGATEVRLAFRLFPHAFVLELHDNGRGFAPAGPQAPERVASGRGLTNMRERLARIGGRCEISSGPDGTTVSFTVEIETVGQPRPRAPHSV